MIMKEMKKIQTMAYAGAIALLSAGFAACSSDLVEEAVTPSPGYNPETNEVTADFVFNVSTGTSGNTRMTSADVQANVNTTSAELFRGIDNAKLFSFKVKNADESLRDGWHISYAPTPTPVVKMFNLGTIMGKGSISPAIIDGSATQSRRVVELNLPTETNTLLFYGKAIKDGTDATQGKVEMDVNENGNMNQNFFRLCKIIPSGSDAQTEFLQSEALIAAVLTKIIRSSYTTDATVTDPGDATRTISSGKTFKWQDYVTITRDDAKITKIAKKTTDPAIPNGGTAGNMSNLGEILADAYVTFNTIHERDEQNELRAGSGPAISRMMADLYSVISSVKDAVPTNLEETIAKRVAKVICDNIEACFDKTTGAWKENSSLKTFAGLGSAQVDKIDDDLKFTDFPKDRFGLPYGATVLEIAYNATAGINAPEYSYMGAVPTYAMGGTSGASSAFDPSNWCFPPELMYFGNSPVRVTDLTKATGDYPDGTTNWTNSSNPLWDDWTDNSHVKSTTRSVAMRDCVNYGNALLRMRIKYGTNVLKDNNHQIQYERTGANENDNLISVGSAGAFELTGIAIGGQNRSVGWNFIPRLDTSVDGTATAPQFGCMVFDSNIPSTAIPAATSAAGGSESAYNYTLLWDNYDESLRGQSQRVVYVALEFKNTSGKDFWGMNNLIRKDGTFYITAKLDPDAITVADKTAAEVMADKSLGIDWPVSYEIPPYYVPTDAEVLADATLDSKTVKERRVFMQDYATDVTFVLTEESLKHALVAVPDLRSSQISLGLSVDLHWRQGLQFGDVNVNGGQ